MIIGIADFRGGETRKTRVRAEEPRRLKRVAGYDFSRGELAPDRLPTRRSTAADVYTGGAPPAQVPCCFVDSSGARIIYRDASDRVWVQQGSTWEFAGARHPCTFSDVPDPDWVRHGGYGGHVAVNDQVRFGATAGGVVAGERYWVVVAASGGDFQVSSVRGGQPVNLTHGAANTYQTLWGDDLEVLADGAPARVDGMVIFPTGGGGAKLMAFEPQAAAGGCGMVSRPLGLKAPTDYAAAEKPTVVASAHSQRPLFDIGTTHWAALGDGTGTDATRTDYQSLIFYGSRPGDETACPADQTCFTFDLGTAGAPVADRRYLAMDVVVTYAGTDPATEMLIAGEFVNSDQQVYSSGFELRLYRERPSHGDFDTAHVLRTYKIPRLDTTGRVNRVAFHLGALTRACTLNDDNHVDCTGHGLSVNDPISFGSAAGGVNPAAVYYVKTAAADSFTFSESVGGPEFDCTAGANTVAPTVRGLGIRTAANFVRPAGTGWYTLWVYSHGFTENWAYQGNCLLPAAAFPQGHWCDALPPDPGGTGTCAVVLETFAESGTGYTPRRPWQRWCYAHRGRSELANDDYRPLLSNPSLDSDVVLADPWRTYQVTVTIPVDGDGNTVLDEYTDGLAEDGAGYLTHLLYYRQERDAEAVWSERTFIAAAALTDFTVPSVAITDDGADEEPVVDGLEVPKYVETNHDYPSSAQFVAVSDGRVYALGLDWQQSAGVWRRAKDLEVSNYQDYGSFPTTTSDPPEESEGEELSGFAPTAAAARGLLVRNDSKFVFLDNQCYELVGTDPMEGWRFLRRDAIGCISARTIADCRSSLIWHAGDHFYAYSGGLAQPISKHALDSSRIDWSEAHGAVHSQDRYLFFCHYDDSEEDTPWCLLLYDLETKSWRRRHSTSYHLAGLCAADASGAVYGVTHDGNVVDLFGGPNDYGGDQRCEVWTQYLVIAPPGEERHVSTGVLQVVTDQPSLELTVDFYSQGRADVATPVTRTLTVTSSKTLYADPELNVDLVADAVAMRVRYTGATPPTIHFVGMNVDPQ